MPELILENKGMRGVYLKTARKSVKGHNKGFLLLIFPNLAHLERSTPSPINDMCCWRF